MNNNFVSVFDLHRVENTLLNYLRELESRLLCYRETDSAVRGLRAELEYMKHSFHEPNGMTTADCRRWLEYIENGYFQEIEKKQEVRRAEKREQKKRLRALITNVKFDDPWTIVWWSDGDITRVKCAPEDTFDKEKGLMVAIAKHFYEDTQVYADMMRKWCGE